jgi:predicted O-methyltransferase YrrM
MDAQPMLHVVDEILRLKPRLIVECGSGTSTLWLAYALQRTGSGKVVTLEHSPSFADSLRQQLQRHELESYVDLRVAPLEKHGLGSEKHDWYAKQAISDIANVEMLLIDGPPGWVGPMARYPAMPILIEKLCDGALIIFDDSNRADETEVKKRWFVENPCLGHISSIGRNTLEFRVVRAVNRRTHWHSPRA